MARRRMAAVAGILALAQMLVPGTPVPSAGAAPPSRPELVGLQPIDPYRLLDTRELPGGVPLGPGGELRIPVLDRGGIPAEGVESVALNVSVTEPTAPGYFTVWPTGTTRNLTATLNFLPGQTTGNAAVVGVGDDGSISVFNYDGTAHVIVDVTGWFPTGHGVHAVTPERLLDTRESPRRAPLGQGATLDLRVTERGEVPASGVIAVALNVAVTEPTADGYVTVYPTGEPRPLASSGNFAAGQTVSNNVIAKVGAGGSISIFNYAGQAHVVVDITGYLTAAGGYVPLTPIRLADTRDNDLYAPARGGKRLFGFERVSAGVTERFHVIQPKSGHDDTGLPFSPRAVVLNVAITSPSTSGFVTVWPDQSPRPGTANLNYLAGQTLSNTVIVGTFNHAINLSISHGTAHVVIDVIGYFPDDGVDLLRIEQSARRHGTGTDRIGVFFCEESGSVPDLTPGEKAEAMGILNGTVRQYFEWASEGTYSPEFTALGSIPGAYHVDGSHVVCDARMRISPVPPGFDGLLGIDVLGSDTEPDRPPAVIGNPGATKDDAPANGRQAAVSATAVLERGANRRWVSGAVRAIGNMLDFPPFANLIEGDTGYHNALDVMSEPDPSATAPGEPIGTLAVNRLRAGWLAPSKVQIHRTSGSTYEIDPIHGAGTQLVVVPSSMRSRFTTIETRVAKGHDATLRRTGVAVHTVDTGSCHSGFEWTCRESGVLSAIAPATGTGFGISHVLQVGQSLTLGDVTISVTGLTGDRYTVTVTGTTYEAPDLVEYD